MADFEDASFPGEPVAPLLDGGLPGDHRAPVDTAGVFGLSSYEAILYGMDFLHDECDLWYGKDRPASQPLKLVDARAKLVRRYLPTHDAWLQSVCGIPDFS
jgi:tryptophan halogenase